MNNIKTDLGLKFFKEDNIYQLVDIKDNMYLLKDSNNNITEVSSDDIKEYYKIEPDGYLLFIAAETTDQITAKDVIVTLLKKDKENNISYLAVCRQNIKDMIYDNLRKNDIDCDSLCLTIHDVDENEDALKFMASINPNTLQYYQTVSYYVEDSVDNILSFVDLNILDNTLNIAFIDYLDNLLMDDTKRYKYPSYNGKNGHYNNLKDLLLENGFQESIDSIYGITSFEGNIQEHTFPIKNDTMDYKCGDQYIKQYLQNMIHHYISDNIMVCQYDHSIDLEDINNERSLLVRDSTGTLYILNYLCQGEMPLTNSDKNMLLFMLNKNKL